MAQINEETKFTVANMMAFELNRNRYAVYHSRHFATKLGAAPNQTTTQVEPAKKQESVRVLRFDANGGAL